MASPLSGSLASAIYSGLKGIFLDATLTRDVFAASSPDVEFDPAAPTQMTFACKAIRDNYSKSEMATGLVLMGDAKILILANSITTVPVVGDRVMIQSATFRIMNVMVDPALALYTCQGRL